MNFTAHFRAGHNSLVTGDHLTAQSEFAAALSINPRHFQSLQGISIVLYQVGRVDAAILAARRAIDCSPDESERSGALMNCAIYLLAVGCYSEARDLLEASAAIRRTASVLYYLGLALYSLGEFEKSVTAYDDALDFDPGNMDLVDHRGIAQLGAGRYVEGLIDNKVRWGVLKSHPWMHSDVPEWEGQPLHGKRIIVLHEQGYGDTFQFVRFVPRLKQMGAAHVVLSVRAECVDLMRLSGLADEVIEIREEPLGGLASMDYKCPMLTVPAHMGLTVETIPGEPYLRAPLRRPVLTNANGRLRVGLVWAGKPMYAADQWRSMHPLNLLPLIERHGDACAFYSLQQDERKRQLWETGLNAFVTDLAPRLGDWSDAAAIMSELDLLVSVDTAPAHLMGAMGRPVALMIPQASCWRWLGHDTATSPWYPSMSLHRQVRQGDWAPVVASVGDQVEQMLSQHQLRKAS